MSSSETHKPDQWHPARIARWSGVVGFTLPALTLAVRPIWSYPSTEASGADVASWVAAHQKALQVSQLLNTVGVTVWLVFGAAVYAYLRGRLHTPSIVPACFITGLGACVTLLLSGFTAFNLLLYRTPSATTATLLYDMTFGLLAMSGLPTVVAAASCAIAAYRHRVLPRYCGHVAAACALMHPLLLVTFVVDEGVFSLEGPAIAVAPAFLFAWILATALAMPHRAQASTEA